MLESMATCVWDRHRGVWVPVGPSDQARQAMRIAAGVQLALIPAHALAHSVGVEPSTFQNVMGAILTIGDYLAQGVFIYSGACWMLGDRTKAMQHLIGGAVGYLIIRKAGLIRDFIKGL